MSYSGYHTSFDVMKEYLIIGAELDGKYQIPMLPCWQPETLPEDSIDFAESLTIQGKVNKTNINFYIDDCKFQSFWNNPDKYIKHLKCFHSVCNPDFSIAVGERGMPFPLYIYNKFRNHALGWYSSIQGVPLCPSVGILDRASRDWAYDGYPLYSTISTCTNGRIKAKKARIEFVEEFKYMLDKLCPTRVIIVGAIPDELNVDIPIINFKSRSQKVNEYFGNKIC